MAEMRKHGSSWMKKAGHMARTVTSFRTKTARARAVDWWKSLHVRHRNVQNIYIFSQNMYIFF